MYRKRVIYEWEDFLKQFKNEIMPNHGQVILEWMNMRQLKKER